MSTALTAHATRAGGWWAVECPEIPGQYTQAGRLDQVEAMVLDAATFLTERSAEDYTVTVVPHLSDEDQQIAHH